MAKWMAILAASLAFVQEDEAAREAVRGYVHPWAGFRPGSRLVFNETTKQARFDAAQGKTVFEDKVTQHVWMVKSVTGEKATIRMEGGGKESDIPIYLAMPGIFRGRGGGGGGAGVAVGERRYKCSVTVISLDADKDAGQATTIWRSAEAPVWAVRVLAETFMGGKRNTWEEELLVEADRKLAIEGREVVCQVVQVTTGAEGGMKTVKREWRTDAVPGRVARRETSFFLGDRENEGAAVKMEVVSFEARR